MSYGDDNQPDHPLANILYNGQQNVTDTKSLEALMRGTELALIGRSDLLGIKSSAMLRNFFNQSFVEQLTAASRHHSEDDTTQLRDERTTIITNKLPISNVADDKLDIDKSFTGLLDLKITSTYMNGFFANSGPPYSIDRTEVEPFRWSESIIRHLPHYGHPDIWNYDLEGINWVWS